MAKKSPIQVTISGARQGRTIAAAFAAKKVADDAKSMYDTARAGAVEVIVNKVLGYWKKKGSSHVGQYDFNLPSGETLTVNVQNRQGSKKYTPEEAKAIIQKIQAGAKDDETIIKGGDIFDVQTEHVLNPEIMKRPSLKREILEVLYKMDKELHDKGTLPPEVKLIHEDKKLKVANHAMDRLLLMHGNMDEVIELLGNPITPNFVDPEKTGN